MPMKSTECLGCERTIDRTARLTVHLTRTAARLHVALNHQGLWAQCRDRVCQETLEVLEGKRARRAGGGVWRNS